MSYAIIFAGQGSQHSDMMPWLSAEPRAAPALREMEKYLGGSWRATLEDPLRRGKNQFAQPLIVGTALAAWESLKPDLPMSPAVVAGYSVGELAAFACAGVIAVQQAIDLATIRADLMNRAVAGKGCGLLSISGVPVKWVLDQFSNLSCAILFDYDHAVFGALNADLDFVQNQLAGGVAVCKRLAIDVASHTPLMTSASEGFSEVLSSVAFSPPEVSVVTNSQAKVSRRISELRTALGGQICARVDWGSCMDALAESGVRCVLEIGPKGALAALWNRRYAAVPARSIEDFQDSQGAAAWVRNHAD